MPGSPEISPGTRQAAQGSRCGPFPVGPFPVGQFPVGDSVTLPVLEGDPHPILALLREREPVSWLPVLGGWLVTRHDIALRVLRDSQAFTVDDPRFSTARIVGPSMLSLDGAAHARHRGPFTHPFRAGEVHARLAEFTAAETDRLVTAIRPAGTAELRRSLAGPLAVAVIAAALGLGETEPADILSWYDAMAAAVSGLAAGEDVTAAGTVAGMAAFGMLRDSLEAVIARPGRPSLLAAASAGSGSGSAGSGGLEVSEVVSNAAVLMFGGIETTEGMIANAVLHLLASPGQLDLVRADPGLLPNAVEESLRLEPAAASVDRYATRDVRIGTAAIRRGDLVTVSITAASRDPACFPDPDRFNVRRENAPLNLAFARGPHFCLGAHLARLQAHTAIRVLLDRLPGLRLDPLRPSAPRGLVFRKPPTLHVLWDPPAS